MGTSTKRCSACETRPYKRITLDLQVKALECDALAALNRHWAEKTSSPCLAQTFLRMERIWDILAENLRS